MQRSSSVRCDQRIADTNGHLTWLDNESSGEEMSPRSDSAPLFTNYTDLISEQVGGKIIFATDDWFATAENLIKVDEPVFKVGLFTNFGKWMDGWETRRKRKQGHDWCIIELGCPGVIHGIEIDTLYFSGNYPPKASVQAICLDKRFPARYSKDRMGTEATRSEYLQMEKLHSEEWMEIVPRSELGPGCAGKSRTFFKVVGGGRVTHIRLNIFPDGGIARLRVYGEAMPDWTSISIDKQIDLVAMMNGGVCVAYSDAHYGHARNVIAPGRAHKMDEGWETARRMDRPAILTEHNGILDVAGYEWAIYRLGHPGRVESVEIDTNHFKGNYPHSFQLEGAWLDGSHDGQLQCAQKVENAKWMTLVSLQKLTGHDLHNYKEDVMDLGIISHVRLTIFPDGGISRMRLFGNISKDEEHRPFAG